MASTTFDLPQPLGPTIHVVPDPLNVTTVRSQNDLKPTISTFRSLSKVSPFVYSRPASRMAGKAAGPLMFFSLLAAHRAHPSFEPRIQPGVARFRCPLSSPPRYRPFLCRGTINRAT